jgi:Zn-dependent peptidase ImmA (M78 family)
LRRLRTSTKTFEWPSPDEILEGLLVETGVAGKVPTDEGKVLSFLNLRQLSFDFKEELSFIVDKPDVPANLRAALSLNDRIVVTHANLGAKRSRFSVFHEIGHFVLPEHRDKLFLDTDETLSWWTRVRLEREANEFAADLLFQGNRFTGEALDAPLSARTALDLAPQYGASYESALRRYVERHVLPCAVVIYDKLTHPTGESDFDDDQYKIQYTITSPPFRKLYFSAVESNHPISRASEIYKVRGSCDVNRIAECEMVVEKANAKGDWRFETELLTNGYKIFQFLVRPKKQGSL